MIATGLMATPCAAQPVIGSGDPFQTAFREMIARPGDPDAAVRYARLAAERGDSRAAITALERVLRINPSLDNIRLEIASIHLAAGSPDLAALYARQALESPSIPPDVAVRAREIVAQAERGASRSLLEVSLFAGARWDSNANGVTPAGTTVPIYTPVPGGFFVVPTQLPASGEESWSSVLGARLYHRYDLELQREAAWETNASLFDQRFASIPRAYDLSVVTLDSGPRIGVTEVGENGLLSLRPAVRVGWIGYADSTYSWQYGAGLTAELRLPPRWTFEVTGIAGFGNFINSDFRPTARLYTGSEFILNAAVSYAITPTTRITGSFSYFEGNARVDYYARSGLGGFIGAQTAFNIGDYQVGATARLGVRQVNYDSPDPVLNPFTERKDTRWEGGVSLIFPVTRSVAITVEYDGFDQRSNYEIYRFDNHAFTAGVRVSL
ncbi:tetratricopeptide repeat protein [Roseomonas rosulenta]|uniref:tetratricopeptide repeat protein n=1 Tax=Roseomonas rosulenta TaxID=2748667 RepID=UPI0018DFD86F|nr:hypothetical protein [Roseomonas rosulenta]